MASNRWSAQGKTGIIMDNLIAAGKESRMAEGDNSVGTAAKNLKAIGINAHSYVSPGTAHEWQTWRRSLYQFAQLLFK